MGKSGSEVERQRVCHAAGSEVASPGAGRGSGAGDLSDPGSFKNRGGERGGASTGSVVAVLPSRPVEIVEIVEIVGVAGVIGMGE